MSDTLQANSISIEANVKDADRKLVDIATVVVNNETMSLIADWSKSQLREGGDPAELVLHAPGYKLHVRIVPECIDEV